MRKVTSILTAVALASSIALTGNTFAETQKPAATNFTPEQTKSIQQIVHDYLVNNPEVLVEASQKLQEKMQQQQQAAAMKAINDNKAALFEDPNDPSIGPAIKDAKVTMVEFFDYQCAHCKNMAKTIEALSKDNKDLRVVFKEFPIFGADSEFASKAALAAKQQGMYYKLHSALLSASNPLSKAKVLAIATKAGLNVAKLQKDMQSSEIQQQIMSVRKLAAQDLGIQGTPAFILGSQTALQSKTAQNSPSSFSFIPGETSQQNLQAQINKLK